MRIDKVVFSTTNTFSGHWNYISEAYASIGITPECLLFGDRDGMSERYGRVISMPVIEDIPLLIQLTWSKFRHPITEPETTWLVGDIDLYPLNPAWFTSNISDVPDDHYVHLDADGIQQLAHTASWCTDNPSPVDLGHETNVPGHYHVAKGRIFELALEQHLPFADECRDIIAKRYGSTRGFRPEDQIEQHGLWCAEEMRSSKALRRSIQSGKVRFKGFSLKTGVDTIHGDRIDRTTFIQGAEPSDGYYKYDESRFSALVDLHASRPFEHSMSQTLALLRKAGRIQ